VLVVWIDLSEHMDMYGLLWTWRWTFGLYKTRRCLDQLRN